MSLQTEISLSRTILIVTLPEIWVCSSAYCLLFGDAIRMLCCVDAMSSVQILDTVLAHCASTYCMVDSRFVCLQTQNTRVSLSPLQSIGSFKLTVIPCPKFSALHELLRLALENMPLSMDLISCARLNHMISMCRSLVRYGQNSPLMRGLPRANLPYVCQLVTEAFRSITEQLDPQVLAAVLIPCLHREPDAVEPDLPDNAVPADLISYLSPFWWRVLSTALLNPNHILGLGVLTRSFQLVYRQLFHNSSLSVDQSDTPLFFSFCHRLSGLHRHVSSCLSHLRDTYASLVSAGSCLSARVRLSRPDECDDSASLKLEQGRARLFASAQAARNNVARILRNEIIPYLRVLFEECEQYTHMLNRFVVDSQLMGPFLSDTPYLCSPECRRISLTIKQSLITLERQCSIQWTGLGAVSHTYNTPSAFYQIAIRMHNFLEKQLANFLVSFQTSLFHISHSLKSSLRAIDSTWLSAFACPDGEHVLVDSRAASDVQLLASKLQEQYDLIETFIRNHHNTSIPMFYDRMSSIQSLLMKTGLNRTQIDGTHLLLGRVRIPYGSKNKPEDVRALDTLRNTVSVPDWPPTPVNKVPTLETNHANQTSSNSPVSNCVSSDKQSLPVVIMRRSVAPTVYVVPPRPGTDGSDVLPVPAPKKSSWYVVSSKPATGTQVIRSRNNPGSVNMNSSPPEYSSLLDTSNSVATTSSGSTTGTKRVCIRLSHEQHTLAGSTEIIEQRPFKPGLDISTKMPFIRAVRMDRRRLGRLKRRMKISHSSCIQNRSRRSGQPEDMSSLDLCSHNSDENSRQLLTDEAVTICSSDDEDRNSQKNSAVAVNSAENSPGRIEGVTMPPPADLSGTKLNLVERNLQRSDIHFDVLSTDVVINYSTRDGTVESHSHTAHAESGKQQPTVSFSPDRSLEPSALDRSETATPDMNISSALVTTGSFVWNSSERPVPVSPRIVQDKSHANQDGVDCTDVENARFQSRPFSSNTQSILETEDLQTSPLVIGCNHHSSTNESDAMRADSSCDIAKNDPERTNATGPNNLDSRNLQTEQNSTDFDSVSRIPTSVDPRPSAFPDSVENCHLDVSASKCCYSPTTIAGFPSTVDTDHVRVQSAKVQLSADFKNNTHMNDSDSLISLGSLSALPDTHHSTRIGILLERVTAELSELAPWFDKYDSSQCPAPGPITAAALGQMSPQSTAPTLSSIDLTSEDC
ncbi:hypothetical protein D915_003754 [Fasciola hepatica]|uniref:Uncharacterized protein n=1 Tax=Fasciola hepatica TaxID=6192 RepID=A0A4E0RFP3_FASHE|nr:hypothetical protein D915_003754 [Fasciola hepatica]